MKTKTIFKTLALAMLMPTMLLTTACSSEDDVVNTSNITSKGYALPVTVSATRQGDGTRATYNESTKKLEFSAGDKLFVWGYADGYDCEFAGELDYVPATEKFSGTIYTSKEWTGTADALFTAASEGYVNATLLPAGYGSYGFLTIDDDYDTEEKYDDFISSNYTYTLATSKAAGVEQFSYEEATGYSSGFELEPQNAILNFTITGLAASTNDVAVSLTSYAYNITGTVTTDAFGTATFAAGVDGDTDLNSLTLTVAGNPVTLVSSSKELEAGHIYNINRSASPLASVTTSDVGKVIGADGNIYDNVEAAEATTTACAIIAYVGTAGSVDASSTTYKGLAIALTDANSGSTCAWYTAANVTCVSQNSDIATAITNINGIESTTTLTNGHSNHTHAAATAAKNFSAARPTGASAWFLPSMGQWNLIVQGLATKIAGSAVTTDLTTSSNSTYNASNLNTVITDAGGTGFQSNYYWSSTERGNTQVWNVHFDYGRADVSGKTGLYYVRAVFAF